MARQEADREDILREATALVERAELRIAGADETVIVGFRREGAASVFFGQDPVFHFNSSNQLRRAYSAGELIKAESGKLIGLSRERTPSEVQLRRREFSAQEQQVQLDRLHSRLSALRAAITANAISPVAEHPLGGNVFGRIQSWLHQLPESIVVADLPNVR